MQTATEAIEGRYTEEDCGFETPCWIWRRGKTTAGYPECFAESRVRYAHVVMYELHIGPVPRGHDVHHRCEQRACVNPDHLVLLPHDEHAGALGHGKLTREDARRIRRAPGLQREIAAEFGVARSLVSRIKSGHIWAAA